jgi:hypothetical protein
LRCDGHFSNRRILGLRLQWSQAKEKKKYSAICVENVEGHDTKGVNATKRVSIRPQSSEQRFQTKVRGFAAFALGRPGARMMTRWRK